MSSSLAIQPETSPLEGEIDIIQGTGQVPYPEAVDAMEVRVADIRSGAAPQQLWFLEHPPLYTAGTSAQASDLLDHSRFPVYATGRGGQYTYHGPGQRVVYVMMDLKARPAPKSGDVRAFVQDLEAWLIATLAEFGVEAGVREGRIGVWTVKPDGVEAKIAAIGIRVRKWVTYHGIALNIHPDLSHFAGIVPCGLRSFGVTSLQDLGIDATMAEVDAVLSTQFQKLFC